MNVTMIYPLDPSHDGKGGAVRYINNLIRNLLTQGVSVTLIGAQITDQAFSNNFKYIPIMKFSSVWWRYPLVLFFKLPFLKLPPYTIIHVHRLEYVLPFLFFNRNNPLIYTIHGDRLGTARSNYSKINYTLIESLYFLYEKLAFNRVNKIIAVSENSKESFTRFHPSIINKTHTIPVGIDLKLFNKYINKTQLRKKYFFKENDFLILFAGVLGKVKNLSFLIDSFKIISTQVNAKLVIVGDGAEKPYLLSKVKELNLENKVIFVGEVDHSHINELFLISDLFTLTSNSEGSPTVIKEALASGIPIVSINVGDVKEVINNNYLGRIVEEYDTKSFANAMLETIEFIDDNRDLVYSKCKSAAKKYSIENVTKEIIQVYKSLIDGVHDG
jgi:L-malate glycosyltransferase